MIQQITPATKVLAILSPADEPYVNALCSTQIAGCIFEHEISTILLHLLRTVAAGGTAFSGNVMHVLLSSMPDVHFQPTPARENEPQTQIAQIQLTQREWEVLRLLAQGLSNKAIAQALTLSEKTIEFHLKHLFEKLNVTSRTAAALAAKTYDLSTDR